MSMIRMELMEMHIGAIITWEVKLDSTHCKYTSLHRGQTELRENMSDLTKAKDWVEIHLSIGPAHTTLELCMFCQHCSFSWLWHLWWRWWCQWIGMKLMEMRVSPTIKWAVKKTGFHPMQIFLFTEVKLNWERFVRLDKSKRLSTDVHLSLCPMPTMLELFMFCQHSSWKVH